MGLACDPDFCADDDDDAAGGNDVDADAAEVGSGECSGEVSD